MQAPTAGLARRAAAPPSITAEALLPLLPPSAEGVLFKRGQLLKGWSPGRYELKGSLLLFYKNGQLSRSVPLHGYRAHLRTDVRAPHGEVLVLRHQSDPQQRDYWFCVPTAAAAGVAGTSLGPAVPRGLAPPNVRSGQEWVDALNTAAAAAALTPADFEVLCEIGTGAYGKVSLVRKRGSLALLALKEIRKDAAPHMPRLDSESPEQHVDRVRHKNSKNMMWVMGERSSLQAVGQHPYVAALQYAFETDDCWFLALDFVPGGDLFDHAFVQEQKRFSEAVVRVWAAELVCVLEFIHSRGIVHRDIKLENLLLDLEGHVHLADFGFSCHLAPGERAHIFCGTKYYVAPEMLVGQRTYNNSVDWWGLGVVIYELLTGLPPFFSRTKERLYQKIVHCEVQFKDSDAVSPACRDLLRQLLNKDPAQRLGARAAPAASPEGLSEVRRHPWFDGVDWEAVEQRRVAPLWQPESPFVRRSCDSRAGAASAASLLMPHHQPHHTLFQMTFSLRGGALNAGDAVHLREEVLLRKLSALTPAMSSASFAGSPIPGSPLGSSASFVSPGGGSSSGVAHAALRCSTQRHLPARLLGFEFCVPQPAAAELLSPLSAPAGEAAEEEAGAPAVGGVEDRMGEEMEVGDVPSPLPQPQASHQRGHLHAHAKSKHSLSLSADSTSRVASRSISFGGGGRTPRAEPEALSHSVPREPAPRISDRGGGVAVGDAGRNSAGSARRSGGSSGGSADSLTTAATAASVPQPLAGAATATSRVVRVSFDLVDTGAPTAPGVAAALPAAAAAPATTTGAELASVAPVGVRRSVPPRLLLREAPLDERATFALDQAPAWLRPQAHGRHGVAH